VRRWKKGLVLSDTEKLARRNETNSGKTLWTIVSISRSSKSNNADLSDVEVHHT
jgi:hypothetical protein